MPMHANAHQCNPRIALRVATHTDWIYALAISPDGQTVVTADGQYARLWNAATGELIGQPMPHSGYGGEKGYQAPVFSPDGKTLLTANQQQVINWGDEIACSTESGTGASRRSCR